MPRLTGLGLAVKSAATAGGTQTITGPHIASTAVVYAPMLHRGAVEIAGVTHYEGSGISAASFDHETPAGDNRLLVVVAVYKDTAGVNSAVWGTSGTGNGQFSSPNGVAVAGDGSVYVADTGNHRIQKFNSSGAYTLQWGSSGTGDGEFSNPYGVAVAGDGSVYVADAGNNRIQKFNSSGAYTLQWGSSGTGDGEFNYPTGVSIDGDGDVYVVDIGNNRVQKFSSSGTYVAQWGSSGTGDGELNEPYFLAVGPDGSVYVADYGNNRIQKFDEDGAFIDAWGTFGRGNGQFVLPLGVAAASDGSVYVADADNSRVQKFDADGVYLAKWGSYGTGDGQFNNPSGVAIAPDGAVYVADNSNNRIQKFDAHLKLNTARYGGEEMEVGPLVDAGSYFVAFYTLENPPVGTAEVAFAAPTEPDIIMLTAISVNGADTADTDYTGPDAGRAEQEAHTTNLQVSHDRTYPTNTMSLWAALYESAGTTLTGASGNHVWIERNVGNLRLALGWRPTAAATSGIITYGATASPAVTPRISSVLHIEGARGHIDAPHIAAGSQVFAPVFTLAGQTFYPGHIASTAAVYAPAFKHLITAPHIASTATVYAPTFAVEPGATQFIQFCFIGGGTPMAFNGPHIASTAAVYEPSVTATAYIELEFIESGEQIFVPTFGICLNVGDGEVFAPTFANV